MKKNIESIFGIYFNINLLPLNDVPRTSRIFGPKQIINLLLLSNLYPMINQWIQKEEELLYTVWSLVMVREPVASARG